MNKVSEPIRCGLGVSCGFFAVAMLSVATAAMAGPTPEQKCQGGKNNASGKYAACLAKAEKSLVSSGDVVKYGSMLVKCEDKLTKSWTGLEQKAVDAGTVCPTTMDQSGIGAFLDACLQSVASALAGDPLPVDVATCNDDLTICNDDLATASAGLSTCTVDLSVCQNDLSTANGDLTSCQNDLSATNADLGDCSTDLATAEAGTAAAVDVLAGETFSSAAGLGVTGTMPDNGAVVLTPTTSDQAIAAGYHDGSGVCEGDADLVASNILSGVDLFGVLGTRPPGAPAVTGQTTANGAGSDGDLERGLPRSFTDNGDGTITDDVTGLMWEKKSNDGTVNDKDNNYTWSTGTGLMDGTIVTTFLATLNAGGGFAGYTDWRIPNLTELETLRNLENTVPATFAEFNTACPGSCTVLTCNCTSPVPYWSSSRWQANPGTSWRVDFDTGAAVSGNELSAFRVRAVRGGF